jgi:transporter family protein
MERWHLYAIAAAVFAGITSVLAKLGLQKLGADVGLAVRTLFVFGFVLLNTWLWTGTSKAAEALSGMGWRPLLWLALSALTTTLSWVCYYRAMHEGPVSYVALIDKGSILVTLVLSVLVLGEAFTWRMGVGGALVLGGLLVLASGT